MKWSQLKTRVEAMFADAVRGRVELRTTRYTKAHDKMGRGWITIDGEEVINMCSFTAELAHSAESVRRRKISGCTSYSDPAQRKTLQKVYADAHQFVKEQGIFSRSDFSRALFDYLNLSIDAILTSSDPLIRAIGMLDRRLGKRRLAMLEPEDHVLVKRLYQFRYQAEHLTKRAAPDT